MHSHSELKQDILHGTASLGLNGLIRESTRWTSHSANIPDLILTYSPGNNIKQGRILTPNDITHHDVVYCIIIQILSRNKPYYKHVWNYEENDVNCLLTATADIRFDNILENSKNLHVVASTWRYIAIHGYIIPRQGKCVPKTNPG